MTINWTIKNTLNFAIDTLKKYNIATYNLDAEILISHILNINRVKLYMDFNKLLSKEKLYKIKTIISRRTKYEPIAYLLGYKEFYGLSFYVNSNVLIPRPETELLIDEILQYDLKNKKILDIGTGSGNIGITIKKTVTEAIVTCSDISSKALNIALKNKNNLLDKKSKIEFIKSNIYSDISGQYDYIISNPPYISSDEMKTLPDDVNNFEPHIALNGGCDGMVYYNKIISPVKKILKHGGCLFLEINPSLKEKIVLLINKASLKVLNIKKDYNGYDRIIIIKNEY